jgi:hypothetical protein
MTETTSKNSNSIFKTIGISFVVLIILFVVYSLGSNNISYKKEIKLLKTDINTLQEKLNNSVDRDSIMNLVLDTDSLNQIIMDLNKKMTNQNKKNEKTNRFINLPIDSNVVILSRYLSEEDSFRE